MRLAILGFVGGAALLQSQAALPERPVVVALACAVAILFSAAFFLARARASARPGSGAPAYGFPAVANALAGAFSGFLWAALLAHHALAPQLARADEGRDITLVGTIDNLPYRFPQGVRFNFAVEKIAVPPGTVAPVVPPKIALSWYAGHNGDSAGVGDVRPGERWRLAVRLQRPHGNANPHGFDYEVWLLEQGLRATGYVREAGDNRRLDGFVWTASNVVEAARAALRARILEHLAGKKYAGVIVALVVGDQRGIAQPDWNVFNRSGIGHLISISGLHITMIAGLFALGASTLWRHSFFTDAQLPLLLPAQKVAALAGAGAALFYVLLAGFGVPAQRTLYMLCVVAVALWCGRASSVSHVLCAALGIVVLLDPWAVLWPGFWLSFGAVATILYATAGRVIGRRRHPDAGVSPVRAAGGEDGAGARSGVDHDAAGAARWDGARRALSRALPELRAGAHLQYVVTMGLVPLTLLLFSQVSLISPVANALAIPLVSLVVAPLSLVGSVAPDPLAGPLLQLAHLLVASLAAFLAWLGEARLAVWSAPQPPWWLFCWALFGTAWTLAPRGWPQRWTGLAAWLPLLTAQPDAPAENRFTVTAFDVGQGMALLVETAHHRLLYDTGPAYSPESDGGNRVIVPYLKARGIDALDGLIVSHSDSDHSGGALTLLANIRVDWLLSSLPPGHAIARTAPRHVACVAGQRWDWDGVRFEMLHPAAASYADASLKPNARGCTLRISAAGKAMLLAADIEAPQENQLLQRARTQLAAAVLLAPHHGSGTSSTPAFLAAVHPQIAVFQAGYRNRYHHPKPEVYARYGRLGIARLRTDELGALTLDFGDTVEVSAYRQVHARYWYGR